jgi:predicted TIM-barrel fold metal-dependent hydrolase
MQTSSLAGASIIDGHVHFVHPECLEEMLAILEDVPCRRFNLVCVPELDGSNHNAAAVFFKKRFPERAYISGALDYRPVLADLAQGAQLLAGQVQALQAQGFDGLKLIEGKPQVRKLLPYPLDGPLYAGMWQALEQMELPVLLHVADPDEFWDHEGCPDWARKFGWDYSDGTYPSKQGLYAEVETILSRHPRLKLTLAHFFFLSHELRQAGCFLDAHPNVCFDLAPHMDMYRHFSDQPMAAREFLIQYQDRILYGTDMDTRALKRGQSGHAFMRFIPHLIRSMLEKVGPFLTEEGTAYHGLGLPEEVLEKIYRGNFERIYGTCPARWNGD